MALRLVRKASDEPSISNKDDVVMARYAYGGKNGVVKAFSNECGWSTQGGTFKIFGGRICLDGWEADIDAGGVILDFSNVTGTQYIGIYLELNVSIESVDIKSVYGINTYPTITHGDDLTQIPNGTARLPLYRVKVVNGIIQQIEQAFNVLPYATDEVDALKNNLEQGIVSPKNSMSVNGLDIKQDENGVLRIGDIIIPQKRLLWRGSITASDKIKIMDGMPTDWVNKTLKFGFKVDGVHYSVKGKVGDVIYRGTRVVAKNTNTVGVVSFNCQPFLENTALWLYILTDSTYPANYDLMGYTYTQVEFKEIYEIIE